MAGKIPKTDEEWRDAIDEEAVRQILATPDADVIAGNWPPLVKSIEETEAERKRQWIMR